MADRYWNRLQPRDEVVDRNPYRGVALFGRPTRSHETLWTTTAEFDRLVAAASPRQIGQAGYNYLYMDEACGSLLSSAQRSEFTDGCALKRDEELDRPDAFRTLYDLRECRDPTG